MLGLAYKVVLICQQINCLIIKKQLICCLSSIIFSHAMTSIHTQLKQQRTKLGFKQSDMLMRVGISRQQYQQIESKGNPRLNTLELIAEGLNCQLMLIPKDKILQVQAILDDKVLDTQTGNQNHDQHLIDNPWQTLLGEDD